MSDTGCPSSPTGCCTVVGGRWRFTSRLGLLMRGEVGGSGDGDTCRGGLMILVAVLLGFLTPPRRTGGLGSRRLGAALWFGQ